MDRQFKGIWIPAEVWMDTALTLVEKALLAEIDSFSGNGKTFYKSNETIVEEYGISKSTISRAVKKLQKAGYIEIHSDGRNRYITARPCSRVKMTTQDGQNDHAEASKRRTTNTIDRTDNNTSKKRASRPKGLEEVVAAFTEVGAAETDAMAFYDYYEANGWTQGRNKPIKDWKAAARGWIRRTPQFTNNAVKRTGPSDGSLIAEHLRRLAAESGESMA
jgi:DNA-binding transcriptional MocR family regulator